MSSIWSPLMSPMKGWDCGVILNVWLTSTKVIVLILLFYLKTILLLLVIVLIILSYIFSAEFLEVVWSSVYFVDKLFPSSLFIFLSYILRMVFLFESKHETKSLNVLSLLPTATLVILLHPSGLKLTFY